MAILRIGGRRIVRRLLLWSLLALAVNGADASQYFRPELYQRVSHADMIVLARVVDPARAVVFVERALKGESPSQIMLSLPADSGIGPPSHKPLLLNAVELLFLKKKGESYVAVSGDFDRFAVDGDRLTDPFTSTPLSLSQVLRSIERLVQLQLQAAHGDGEGAYVAALKSNEADVQIWALSVARDRIKVPSPALADAVVASWPQSEKIGPVIGPWSVAGLVANAVVAWRLKQAAPFFARILAGSANGDERAWAAMALGGSGDRDYLVVLRRVAADDPYPQARALAYNGIMHMLGPDSLPDLCLGAKDPDDRVRGQVVADSYNLLEFGHPDPRWPPPSDALIAEVRAFLTEMTHDPVRQVSSSASSMLENIARRTRR